MDRNRNQEAELTNDGISNRRARRARAAKFRRPRREKVFAGAPGPMLGLSAEEKQKRAKARNKRKAALRARRMGR